MHHPDTTPQVIRIGVTRCAGATVCEIDGGPSGTWCEITWADDPFDMPTTITPGERRGRDSLPRAIALAMMCAHQITIRPHLELSGVGR
jgi:hypothetical protein